jgi:two-component system, NarL family, sensor kinase
MVLSKSEFIYIILIIAATFLILALFFISVVVINARNRRRKKIELLEAELQIQESERERIARDLHDDINIHLIAVKMLINNFRLDSPEEAKQAVIESSERLNTIIADIRNIVRNLGAANVKHKGLVETIEETGRWLERGKKFRFHFIHEGLTRKLSGKAEINIYRIIFEMINNSLKHSNGDTINLSLKMDETQMLLIYSDNGTSFKSTDTGGMGLDNITKRAELLKGTISKNADFSHGAFYHIIFENKFLVAS